MPVSYHEPYEKYKEWVRAYQPKTMWDIGMGYGNIGVMAKALVPDLELNGVEVFVPYFSHKESQYKKFKRIMVSDIRDMIGKMWPVDMITAFDIIEHLEREDGIKVIKYLTSISNMGFLVTVPIIDYPQGPLFENNAEIHRTQWKFEEMIALGGVPLLKGEVVGLFEFKK